MLGEKEPEKGCSGFDAQRNGILVFRTSSYYCLTAEAEASSGSEGLWGHQSPGSRGSGAALTLQADAELRLLGGSVRCLLPCHIIWRTELWQVSGADRETDKGGKSRKIFLIIGAIQRENR